MRIAVLGVGLIGGSIGLAAKEHLADAEIAGFGRDPDRLGRARELGAIDRAAGSLEKALDGAEACFACAPVGALPTQVAEALRAAGRRDLVKPMSLAAAAAGADGIIVEVHNEPEAAICDGPQALHADGFADYLRQLERVAEIAGKQLQAV